jgi:uncharacterized protein (TIGR03086 family)
MDSIAMMNKVLGETSRIVEEIEPEQLDNPTPCEGWTVRDVLNHVTGGADMFAVAAAEGKVPDEQLGQFMGGDNLGSDYKGSFAAASARAMKAFSPPDIADKMITLPFGEMPAGVAVNFAIFDVTTHTWDLAKGTGQSTDLDPEVLAAALEAAQLMLNDDFRALGLFAEAVPVPEDAPLQDRLAGLTGRTP